MWVKEDGGAVDPLGPQHPRPGARLERYYTTRESSASLERLCRTRERALRQAMWRPLAQAPADKLALLAPKQNISWTYHDLRKKAAKLANGLKAYAPNKTPLKTALLLADIPNTAENFILQLALARKGAALATPKNLSQVEQLTAKHNVIGAVVADPSSWLASLPLPAPTILLRDHPQNGAQDDVTHEWGVDFQELADASEDKDDPVVSGNLPLGFFGSVEPLLHSSAVQMGAEAAMQLNAGSSDRCCVSITLCHAFGIGSAVGCALHSGGAIVLPAVGGIRGCGDPKQRAEVTVDVLRETESTLLFADTHTLKAFENLRVDADSLALRSGVVKVGSGKDFLPESVNFASVKLRTLGKLTE